MTFKTVVKALQSRDCWLLVEDSEGELVLGALLSVGWIGWTMARSAPLTARLAWALLALLVYCFIYGHLYQASTPVIYWKRIWK